MSKVTYSQKASQEAKGAVRGLFLPEKKQYGSPHLHRSGKILQKIVVYIFFVFIFPHTGWAVGMTGGQGEAPFLADSARPSSKTFGDAIKQDGQESRTAEKHSRLSQMWSDTKYILSSPLRLTKEDLQPIGIFALTTGTLLLLDEKIRDKVYPGAGKTKRHEMKEFFGNFKLLGELNYLLPISGFAIVGGHFFKNEKLKKTGFMAIESTLIAGLVTQGLKRTFGRRRPRYSDSAYDFHGPRLSPEKGTNSFPSGHTTIAFAAASVVAEQYEPMAIKISVYTLASLVGIQRMYEGAHWASDVFVAATIGTLVGKTVVKLNQKKSSSITIFPTLSPGNKYAGATVRFRF